MCCPTSEADREPGALTPSPSPIRWERVAQRGSPAPLFSGMKVGPVALQEARAVQARNRMQGSGSPAERERPAAARQAPPNANRTR